MPEIMRYGVATISRLLKITGLFCKRALAKRPIFSKERYNFTVTPYDEYIHIYIHIYI